MNSQSNTKQTDNRDQGKSYVGDVEEQEAITLVIIRCDECPETFKQNKQLKVHKTFSKMFVKSIRNPFNKY